MSLLLSIVNVENPNFGIYTRAYLNALAANSHVAIIGAFLRYFTSDGTAFLLAHFGVPCPLFLRHALKILPFVPAVWRAARIRFNGDEVSSGSTQPTNFAASWAQRSVSIATVGLAAMAGSYAIRRLAAIHHSLVIDIYALAYPCRLLLATIDPRYELGGLTSRIEWLASVLDRHVVTSLRRRIKAQRVASIRSSLGPDVDASPFRYAPLQSNTATRLLRMQTVHEGSSAVICDLVEIELQSAPPYTAVSYVWGLELPVSYLLVHGQNRGRIAITTNARAVLESVVPLDGVRYIWMDSICINQENEDEKNLQITRMAQIFSNANFVLSFLNKVPDAEEAVAFIQKSTFKALQRQHNPFEIQDLYETRRAMIEDHPLDMDDPGWCAMDNMASNVYWSRAWIVQECVMARSIQIIYGDFYCDWFWFSALLGTLGGPARTAKMNRLYPPPSIVHIGLIDLQRINLPEDENATLGELVFQFGLARATDPRDQVHAFLSMSRDADEESLQPRKGLTPQQVYTNLVRYELSQGRFTFLAIAGLSHSREGSTLTDLPSWVPDLTSPRTLMPLAADLHPWLVALSDPSPSCGFSILDSGSSLKLAAICIDTIQYCSSDPDPRHLSQTTLDETATGYDFIVAPLMRLSEMRHIASTSSGTQRYGAGGWAEALWRTLIQNFDGTNIPSKIDFGEVMESLMREGELWQAYDHRQTDHEWRQVTYEEVRSLHRREFEAPDESELAQQALAGRIFQAIRHWTFAVSEKGYWAMVPPGTAPGDMIGLVQGAPASVILRPTGKTDGSFVLWGTAYVHGLMNEKTGKEWDWLVLR